MFQNKIEVFLTASGLTPADVKGRTVVIIDVLRASTSIVTALANGAKEVIPVQNTGDAGRIATNLDSSSYILAGERGGKQVDGFDLGNSPSTYSTTVVGGKSIILSTTNGTAAILAAAEAEEVLIGGFINARAVVDEVIKSDRDVTIVCAGWNHRVALEDTLCAGMLVDLLLNGVTPGGLSDTAYIALWQYRHDADDIAVPIGRCNHAQRLVALGHTADIAICTQINNYTIVPRLRELRLVLDA